MSFGQRRVPRVCAEYETFARQLIRKVYLRPPGSARDVRRRWLHRGARRPARHSGHMR